MAMLGSCSYVGRNLVVDEVVLVGISHVTVTKELFADRAMPPSGNAAEPLASHRNTFFCV